MRDGLNNMKSQGVSFFSQQITARMAGASKQGLSRC
jgi:hypothetical protein